MTVRAEMSRLKRLLGSALGAEPYRFAVPVDSDLATVRQLLMVGADRLPRRSSAFVRRSRPRSEPPSCFLGGVNSGGVERRAGDLSAGASFSLYDALRVADTGCAYQAADDDESAGHANAQPEGVDRGSV
jgi:hypothetical protein